MFSIESVIGTLISGGAVRLYSIGIALYVGSTIGGKVIDTLNSASAAFPTLP